MVYDYDHNLDCYLGPRLIDPTPLTLEQAIGCRLTDRDIYHLERTITGRRRISRIWNQRPLPPGVIIPAHMCGARVPTELTALKRPTATEHCPF